MEVELSTYGKIYNIDLYNKENDIIVLCVVALQGGVWGWGSA
jgi:hypothetical protein